MVSYAVMEPRPRSPYGLFLNPLIPCQIVPPIACGQTRISHVCRRTSRARLGRRVQTEVGRFWRLGRRDLRPCLWSRLVERHAHGNGDERLTESATKVAEDHPWTWVSCVVERHCELWPVDAVLRVRIANVIEARMPEREEVF